MRRLSVSLVLGIAMTLLVGLGMAWAMPADRSVSNAYWTWDTSSPVGSSTLVRSDAGISATYQTEGLPAGQAVTLWFIVFNNPEECNATPCSVADLFEPAVQGDFLFGGGSIIGADGRGNFGGGLKVGDTSGSGLAEIGGSAVGLLDARGAEVHLALHSHGPALSGQTLKAQLSSFLGGCEVFLGGADGIADGPGDLPLEEGECSTIQASVHFPEE